MFTTFLLIPLAAVFQTTAPQEPVPQAPVDRKVRIEIVTTENGKTKRTTREFDANDKAQMEDAMRELGIMDHMTFSDGDGKMDINIRHFGDDTDDQSVHFFMEPMAPMPPMPPMFPGGDEKVAYLGVSTESATGKQLGALVNEVIKDTPASKLGLKEGDIITQVDGKSVKGSEELTDAIRSHEEGDQLKVTWLRDGKKMNGTTTLSARNGMRYAYRFNSDDGEDFAWTDELGDGLMEHAPRAFLGITPADEEEEDATGVRIGEVVEGSAAETMGMVDGDVVRAINGTSVSDFEALADAIGTKEPGDKVEVTVMRDGKEMKLNGTLGEQEKDRFMNAPGLHKFHFEGVAPEDREELHREMEGLRREMDELRRELGHGLRREMRITVETRTLTPEEKALLSKKGVSGLDKELALGNLQAFPNPSNGMFRVQFDLPERGDLEVDVHDNNGERVYQQRITGFKGRFEHTLDLTDRASGGYFLVISQGGKTATRKLVKE